MSTSVSLEPDTTLDPFVFEHEANSVCSSSQNEGRTENTENTGLFLTHPEARRGIAHGANPLKTVRCSKSRSEDGLSHLGVEAPLVDIVPGSSDSCSVGSATESAASESDSESSDGDLNTLSTNSSDDDTLIYELFPAASFSSLTGIKCHEECTKLNEVHSTSSSDLRPSEAFVRGRSLVKSQGRHSSRRRSGKEMPCAGFLMGDSNNSIGFNGDKQDRCMQDGGEEDSIIECIAEEPVSRVRIVIRGCSGRDEALCV